MSVIRPEDFSGSKAELEDFAILAIRFSSSSSNDLLLSFLLRSAFFFDDTGKAAAKEFKLAGSTESNGMMPGAEGYNSAHRLLTI